MTALNGPTEGQDDQDDTTITKDPESFFVVSIVVFVIFVKAVGAFMPDSGEFRGQTGGQGQ